MANTFTVTADDLARQLGQVAGKDEPTRDGALHRFHFRYTSPTGGIAADTVIGVGKLMPGPIAIDARASHVTWSATVASASIDLGIADWKDPKTGVKNTSGVVDNLADGISIASGTSAGLGLPSTGDANFFEYDTFEGPVVTLTPKGATLTAGVIIDVVIMVVDRR